MSLRVHVGLSLCDASSVFSSKPGHLPTCISWRIFLNFLVQRAPGIAAPSVAELYRFNTGP